MFEYNPWECLPPADCLPDSDDTPVDNELQDLIPHLLKETLALEWKNRWDWFFGVRMGIYYDPVQPAVVPTGFLTLGIDRVFDENLRSCYALWEENQPPILVLEVAFKKYWPEYIRQIELYASMGVWYFAYYNPRRRRRPTLEVYRLASNYRDYILQPGNPVWLPEIGLGIGIERGTFQGITREWLYWYDEQGQRLLTPEEQLTAAERRAQRLAEQLRSLGIEPDL